MPGRYAASNDPFARGSQSPAHKTYANAITQYTGVDEDLIKESPPRYPGSQTREPRAVADVLDENHDKLPRPATPTPDSLPDHSYAQVAAAPPTADLKHPHQPSHHDKEQENKIHPTQPETQTAATFTPPVTLKNPQRPSYYSDEQKIQDLIKESPPSTTSISGPKPGPSAEVLDNNQEFHPPATSNTESLPDTSYAQVAAAPPSAASTHLQHLGHHSEDQEIHNHLSTDQIHSKDKNNDSHLGDDYKDRSHPSSPDSHSRSPLRRMKKRIPAHTLDGGSRREISNSTASSTISDAMSSSFTSNGDMIFEELNGKHGGSLTTAVPKQELQVPKNKTTREKYGELVSGKQAGAGWSKSAIRWAPLNVPLQRRLQTLVVVWHTLCIAMFVSTFFFFCSIPLLWPIVVPYLLYLLFSNAPTNGKLAHRSDFLRSLPIWSLFASYFPARLHRTTVLPPTRKYIFGYHPHGIISHGAFVAFATEALGFAQLFPGITNTLLTIDTNFRIPLYRDYALRMGLASVSRESCEALLSKGGANGEGMGRAITIVVGGAAESLDARPGSLKLVLRRRKGFVKLAIRNGADLVPVLAFGENDLYEQVDPRKHPWINRAQILMKKFLGFTVPLFHARGVFNYDVGLLPYRRPLNIVVGRPIEVEQHRNPDPAYLDAVHKRYTEELLAMWEQWRGRFAPGTAELEIVE